MLESPPSAGCVDPELGAGGGGQRGGRRHQDCGLGCCRPIALLLSLTARALLLLTRPAAQHVACSAEPPKQQQNQQQDAAPAAPAEGADAAGGSVRDALRAAEGQQQAGKRRRAAESTDFMATALTRRFGLAGGLAWVGFLAFGVIGEQVG